MQEMALGLYPWQHQAWAQLQQLQSRWPHAILLHGPAGIGKQTFAEWLAQSLLCESVQAGGQPDGQPCCTCMSCGWFSQYSHPDYRRLRPENLETEDTETVESEDTKNASKS